MAIPIAAVSVCNLYRSEPRAWAQDVKAQRVALSAIARGDERRLSPLQRVFAYVPLEHAENMDFQQIPVEQFGVLRAEIPRNNVSVAQNFSIMLGDIAR
ncbi:DUF924 family protein [Rhodanobacter sp. C03]|uniref:DUF924 family protein n=1 Tax=Rhodanobacter sp. C03 TaxID=1945858 RepID=UPI0009C6F4E0|nr:DUF924 family protein [Rhodanobacter sp. C03]OOG59543.1 hypothetical protein B0E48_01635 [Rhodanobacter sp. C03]